MDRQTTARATAPMIEINALERTFAAGDRRVKALRGVDISVPHGAFVVLMGPSGSGKTTLLNLVGGLDQPTGGFVAVDGRRLDDLGGQELAALRRRIGFIFQSFALMPTATAYENVELGLRLSRTTPRREWDVRVRRCLAAVGLTSWLHHRPYEMSGGQQQRVAIARALAIRPQIILADEPTGDLDSRTGRQVLGILRGLCDQEGVTLLMATHDPAAAEFATDLYRLRDGLVEAHERQQVGLGEALAPPGFGRG
jgi:ABC-type lipoprotein export system ATPase subunit